MAFRADGVSGDAKGPRDVICFYLTSVSFVRETSKISTFIKIIVCYLNTNS